MEKFIYLILIIIGALILLSFGGFAVISLFERERRAAMISCCVAIIGGVIYIGATWLPFAIQSGILLITATILAVGVVLSLLPIGRVQTGEDIPKTRFDERDIMFARWRLKPGSPEYQSYYSRRPEHLKGDEITRSKPGLLSKDSQLADPILFASPEGSFFLTEALHTAVDGPVASEKESLPLQEMTK